MKLSDTHYWVIGEKDEEEVFNWLLGQLGMPSLIGWPTIAARREKTLVGCIVTQAREDAVVCGPLVAETPVILLRLLIFYDNLMEKLGIKEYLFYVQDPDTSPVIKAIEKRGLSCRRLGVSDGQHWYARRVA